jgi:hypothetical protein
MADTMTSQNIGLSSWDILYISDGNDELGRMSKEPSLEDVKVLSLHSTGATEENRIGGFRAEVETPNLFPATDGRAAVNHILLTLFEVNTAA